MVLDTGLLQLAHGNTTPVTQKELSTFLVSILFFEKRWETNGSGFVQMHVQMAAELRRSECIKQV
jgi:hypothetical protein